MAPEHFSRRGGRKGGFPSDVYSFTVLLWEIMTLGKPFAHIKSILQLNDEVVRGNQRPPLDEKGMIFSPSFKRLIRSGWEANPELRPTFKVLRESLQNEAADICKSIEEAAANHPNTNQSKGRRNTCSAEHGKDEEATSRRRSCQIALPQMKHSPSATSKFPPTVQQPTLASLAERTRSDMAETLEAESKRTQADIKRLKSILKVENKKKILKSQIRMRDPDGSESLASVASMTSAPARIKGRKSNSQRVQPQEAAPKAAPDRSVVSVSDLEDSSSTTAIAYDKPHKRGSRKSRQAKPVENFGSTAVSTFQGGAVVRKAADASNRGRSGAESHHSIASAVSAKSARSRASAASRKKKGSEIVLDTVQSVKQIQYLLHQDSDDHIDSGNVLKPEGADQHVSEDHIDACNVVIPESVFEHQQRVEVCNVMKPEAVEHQVKDEQNVAGNVGKLESIESTYESPVIQNETR